MSHTCAINGFDMAYTRHGTGTPLLLLHGFSGCGANWQLVFPDPIAGHDVVVPDLRGHGNSTNPSGVFTFRQSGADVLALMDALGVEQTKAIGISAGAKTLLHAATAQPSRFEALVLVSATPRFPDTAKAAMRMMTVESRPPEEWAMMRGWHHHGDDQIRALWRQARAMAETDDDMNFTAARLATIAARTLVVHGDRDPLYPVELAVELYRGIPQSQLWVVPNGGHGPIFGEHAAAFRTEALAFLA